MTDEQLTIRALRQTVQELSVLLAQEMETTNKMKIVIESLVKEDEKEAKKDVG